MTFVDGAVSSSSRAELVGLIVAFFSNLPVHAAIDSQVVLTTAGKIHAFLSSYADLSEFRARLPHSVEDLPKLPLRRQLPFLPNSDLWLVLWRTLVMRGTRGVRLKKPKAMPWTPKIVST